MFTVGALSIAARRANAVGAVRLTCAPAGLEIELVRVAGFAEGFAPGAIAEPVRFRVPYTAIRGLLREGRMLYLTLDPAVATPHNRFALARFSEDPAEVLARAFRARMEARWASRVVPLPAGALAALAAPAHLVSGAVGRASLGALVALVLWFVLRELVAWRTWGGPLSDRYREALETELSRKLGLVPARATTPSPFEPAPSAQGEAPSFPIAAPRAFPAAPPPIVPAPIDDPSPASRWLRPAIAVAMSGVLAVSVMAFLQTYAARREPPPAVPRAEVGLAAEAQRLAGGVSSSPRVVPREGCLCARADSPLWKDGIASLAVITWTGDDESGEGIGPLEPKVDRDGRPRYDFDLAIVNDAARPKRDVRITLTFARRNAKGRRVGATDRGLFWEGALRPGRAVKWHVRAPGSEVRLDASEGGTLEKAGLAAAPPDAFFELASSRYRAVRIHAATMLAYLRDPRAADLARTLGAQVSADAPIIARISRAAAPVIACSIERTAERLDACVFNGSSRPASGLALREIRDAGDAAAVQSFPVEGAVPVHEGVRVSFPVDASALVDDIAVVAADPAP